ncbi:MAG: hypothetical protein ACRDRU_04290 [Pseudonocardiaceae bacterium]
MPDDATSLGFLRSLRIAASAITAAIMVGLSLPILLSHLGDYPSAGVQVGGYLVVVLIIALDAVLVYWSRSWGPWRWPVATLAVAVAVASRLDLPPGDPLPVGDWGPGQIGWLGVLVLFDQPLVVLLTFIALQVLFSGTILITMDHADQHTLCAFGVVTVGTCSFQLAVGAATVALRRVASQAVAAARQEHDVLIREAVAARLHADRRQRYGELTHTARPLLAGLADGTVDPTDPGARRRCAIEAARMRRLFAEVDDAEDPLLHELRACIDLAERRGVVVALATSGHWPSLPRDLRRALTDAPSSALATATTQARVTVVGTPAGVTVSVVADAVTAELPEPAAEGIQVSSVVDESCLWVEARWAADLS